MRKLGFRSNLLKVTGSRENMNYSPDLFYSRLTLMLSKVLFQFKNTMISVCFSKFNKPVIATEESSY